MAHEIYQTEGIILERRNFGEAERLYIVFTERFGKIMAIAQGVRNIKSKLRYNLEPLSLTSLALVATGESWRIVDASKITSFNNINNRSGKSALYNKVVNFLSRMLQGQEKNHLLWQQLVADIIFLETEELSAQFLPLLEMFMITRILNNLGYLDVERIDFIVGAPKPSSDVLTKIESLKSHLIPKINEAIKSSHL
jgi:DNA repair protein RecO (recombination protein O)